MALGYAVRDRSAFGDLTVRIVDITLDNAYAAGGYTLDPRSCGFGLNGTILHCDVGVAGGFLMEYSPSTGKLLVRDASGVAGAASPEVANNNAAINNVVVRAKMLGKGHG